jgi:phosphocarrier protein
MSVGRIGGHEIHVAVGTKIRAQDGAEQIEPFNRPSPAEHGNCFEVGVNRQFGDAHVSISAKSPTEGKPAPRNWFGKSPAARLRSRKMSGAKKADDVKVTKEFIVINKLGIHARPAAMFVKTANRFECDIFVEKDGEKVNGKSIMGLMMLAAGPGSKLTICAEGHDAARAVVEIETLIKRKFNED